MAENPSIKELDIEKKRLDTLRSQLKAMGELDAAQKLQLKNIEKDIKLTDKQLAKANDLVSKAKEKARIQKLETKEFESFAKKYRLLSQDVQQQLKGTSNVASVYISLGKSIAKDKAIQSKYELSTGENEKGLLERAQERESVFTDISSELLNQAKATQKAKDELDGISEVERQILDIKQSTGLYSAVQKKQLIDALNQTEQLRLKEERLKTIKEEQQSLFEALPESIQNSVGFAKKLGPALKAGALPILLLSSLVLLTLKSFTGLDDAAKEFRDTTGLTNSQMEGIKSDANEIVGQFGNLGIEAKNVFDTVAALKSEFSDTTAISKEVVAGLTVLSANFGVSAENAAKTQAILENVGGLSAETATSVGLQVANMAKLAGVAPAKVFQDMADSSEIASTLFKGNVESFAKATIEARRLGTTIGKMGETAKGLLDFESGITEELTAAAMLGGDFNLTQARSLAYAGDLVGMQNEILNQVQKNGDFSKKDLFTQEQIAKATGMSVDEINKGLSIREKLKSLSVEEKKAAEAAMKAGLDISDIKKEDLATQIKIFSEQQEQQKVLDQLSNQFTGIASTLGSILVPVLESIIPILTLILTPVKILVDGIRNVMTLFGGGAEKLTVMQVILTSIAALWGGIVGYSKLSAFYATFSAKVEAKKAAYKRLEEMQEKRKIALQTTQLGLENATLTTKNRGFIIDKAAAAWAVAKNTAEMVYNGIIAFGNSIKKRGLLISIAEMAMRAYIAIAGIPFIGPILAIAAAAGALALGYSYFGKAGDLNSPADGKTRISTKEGGLFELSPNDDIAAAPGLNDYLSNETGLADYSTPTMGGAVETTTAPTVDFTELLAEIKSLHADLNSGKMAVYMDGTKVTSAVNRVVDKVSTNSYGL